MLGKALRPSESGLADVAGRTEGLSFTYLKKLSLSSMMRRIASPGGGGPAMDAILLELADR